MGLDLDLVVLQRDELIGREVVAAMDEEGVVVFDARR